MTEERRKQIALEYRKMLDRMAKAGIPRKGWVPGWLEIKGISRRSLYEYCRRHGVKTG